MAPLAAVLLVAGAGYLAGAFLASVPAAVVLIAATPRASIGWAAGDVAAIEHHRTAAARSRREQP
ncbi:hypothetical protein amrb99_98180 [Actinomadura sp. RB99]|nr:hypothetical protein [Actinomadura sp. RB99]